MVLGEIGGEFSCTRFSVSKEVPLTSCVRSSNESTRMLISMRVERTNIPKYLWFERKQRVLNVSNPERIERQECLMLNNEER